MKKIIVLSSVVTIIFAAMGCESVKPYQRSYLNDHEMKPGVSQVARFDDEFEAYREGATGGGGSKGSGGCGCN